MSTHPSRTGTVSMVDRLTDACITSAARRWPAEIGESMAYEWRAELAALRTDRALGGIERTWRAIRFAASLAVSPSVEPEHRMSMRWRDRTPGLGRAVMACLGVLSVAMLATVVYDTATYPDLGIGALSVLGGTVPIVNYVFLALSVVGMGSIGVAAARRTGFGAANRSAFGTALGYTAPLGLAVLVIQTSTELREQFFPLPRVDLAVMMIVWTIVTAAATAVALRCARAGRRGVAWVVAIVGNLLALDIASVVGGLHLAAQWRAGHGLAAAWFPLSLVSPDLVSFGHLYPASGTPTINGISISGSPTWASEPLLAAIGTVAGPLLLCSALIAAYTLRASRAAEPAAAPVAAPAPARAVGVVRGVGVAGVVIGVVNWAYLAGIGIGGHSVWLNDWSQVSLRVTAIALVIVSAIVMLAGRGPVVLPAAAIFAVLYTADCIVAHGRLNGQLHGAATAAVLLVVGAATIAGAWWLSGRLAGGATTDTSARRALVGAGVGGALAIPTTIAVIHHPLPAAFVGVSYLLAAALWLVAITAALAGRRTPLGTVASVASVVVPLGVVMLFISGLGEKAFGGYADGMAMLFIQLPLAVVALAATRWNSAGNRLRSIAMWLLLGFGGAVAAIPLGAVMEQHEILGGLIARFEPAWDGPSANQLVLALALGILLARRTASPPSEASTASLTDPRGDIQGGQADLIPSIV